MPRQCTHHRRRVYLTPDDFPDRLELFKEESGLMWAEIVRCLETYPFTIRRWLAGVRPNLRIPSRGPASDRSVLRQPRMRFGGPGSSH